MATLRPHDEYFTYVVRNAAGTILLRSHEADDAVFPPFAGTGFADTPTHRIYFDAALQHTVTIAVAEPLAHRWAVANKAFMGFALPLGLLVPLSLIGVWALVRTSISPIRTLRTAIETRGGRDMTPIGAAGLPSEIEPIAEAVSRLLGRLHRTLEGERSFTSNSAHELRTPVAAALAQTQRLISEARDPALQDRARHVEAALQRLSRLSDKLLQLARAEGGRLLSDQAMNIAPVLGIVVAEVAQGANAAGRIEVSIPSSPVLSNIDLDAFAVLARNLIENALKHGAIDETVNVRLSQDGMLTVSNGGPPVPPELLDRLSRPLERGHTAADGIGLGLAIAKAIASGAGRNLALASPRKGQAGGFEASFFAGNPGA